MDTFLVGGAVRDRLLGITPKERDWVVVGATPEQLQAQGYRAVGSDFPVFLHPESKEEYALARTERKSGHGYGGFTFHTDTDVTLEQDLLRRDLSINAMAEDSSGHLIDPYGGQSDLQARRLRHVSPAFAEDPLRVLRVARFAARFHHLGFSIANETLELMGEISRGGELTYLSPERIWRETLIALSENSPRRYIEVLHQCGALAVLFPEIERLFGVPQRADFHPEVDTGLHVLMALDQAVALSDDPRVRFAVLVHDLGKGLTPDHILPRHIGHEEAGVPLVEAFCERYRVPKRFRQLAIRVTRYHLLCHKIQDLRPGTVLKVVQGIDGLRQPELVEPFLLACEADARGRRGFEDREYASKTWLAALAPMLADISPQPLLEQGLSGAKLGAALERQRLDCIKQYKTRY